MRKMALKICGSQVLQGRKGESGIRIKMWIVKFFAFHLLIDLMSLLIKEYVLHFDSVWSETD